MNRDQLKSISETVVNITEALSIVKGQSVTHDPGLEDFAKEYAKAERYGHGAETDANEKHENNFRAKYDHRCIKGGFGGSGQHLYTNKNNGNKYHVKISASGGSSFWNSNHHISKGE